MHFIMETRGAGGAIRCLRGTNRKSKRLAYQMHQVLGLDAELLNNVLLAFWRNQEEGNVILKLHAR